MQSNSKGNLAALSPIVVFLGVYLLGSLLAGDFYKIPIVVAAMIASIVVVAMTRHQTLAERIGHYSAGATDVNIMLMIWIFVLAGAFAASTKQMGAVDATVALTFPKSFCRQEYSSRLVLLQSQSAHRLVRLWHSLPLPQL